MPRGNQEPARASTYDVPPSPPQPCLRSATGIALPPASSTTYPSPSKASGSGSGSALAPHPIPSSIAVDGLASGIHVGRAQANEQEGTSSVAVGHPLEYINYNGNRSGAIKAMELLPVLRRPTLRKGKEEPLFGRTSNYEAALAQCAGEVRDPPCSHCAKGYGRWTLCCVVRGQLHGSCANCHVSGDGARCSFRAAATTSPSRKRTCAVFVSDSGAVSGSVGSVRVPLSPISAYKAEYNRLKQLSPRAREEERLGAAQLINIVERLAFEEAGERYDEEE